ncbi:MAG TPA: DUF3883 domain-containing protein [Dissulfurispiraceae bacterium]|nr:DUF3883 domain-containing protein [Dissulfurispiraceae bacterium]
MVEIVNDGRPFAPEDVDSVCSIARSWKKPDGYIGYLGVGFKSVFLVSDRPEVHSGPYHFAFRPNCWPQDFPWQVMPVTLQPEPPPGSWTTRFVLPHKGLETSRTLRDEMSQAKLNGRVLLFLKNLSRLELTDEENGVRRVVERHQSGEATSREDGLTEREFRLAEEIGEKTTQERWLVVSRCCQVPPEVQADPVTHLWNRSEVRTREVMLAIKLTEEGKLDPDVRGTAHLGVFSFLPLREESTGLKFVIQADFLTAHGRETIRQDSLWNHWVAGEVLKLIKLASHYLLAHEQRRTHALEVLWPEEPRGAGFFAEHLKGGLAAFLERDISLPAYDGSWVKPGAALYVVPDDLSVESLISPPELEQLYGKDSKPLLRGLVVPQGLTSITRVDTLVRNNGGFLRSPLGKSHLQERAAAGDVDFFKRLLEILRSGSEKYWHAPTWRAYLHDVPVVLTESGDASGVRAVYFKPAGREECLPSNLTYVHPLLASGPPGEFLEFLGVSTPSDHEIKEANRSLIGSKIQTEWSDTSPEKRWDLLVRLKATWERDEIGADDLKTFVTLPAKSGAWLPPDQLRFPSELQPNPDIERLLACGLLRQAAGEAPVEFVSPELVSAPAQLGEWVRFLSSLGVGARTQHEENSWIECIAARASLWYEQDRGRDVDPSKGLGLVLEVERGQGYDLKSQEPDGKLRLIEVKGSRGDGPFTFRSTTLQKAFLPSHRDQFYFYLVTDALTKPLLHVVHARTIDPQCLVSYITNANLNLKDLPVEYSVPVGSLLGVV